MNAKQKEIISEVHDYVKKECVGFSEIDDVFENHVLNVVRFAKLLAKGYKSNEFAVVLAAYLHDLTYIQTHNHDIHHTEGAEFVRKYLKKFDIPDDEINLISLCILHHRGEGNPKKESMEERIVACADAMDHIDRSLHMFFRGTHGKWSYDEALKFIRAKLQRSWKKIELDKARDIVREKYEAARVLFGF